MFQRTSFRWLLFFLGATLAGLFLASQSWLLYKSYASKSIPVFPLLVLSLVQTWTWFLLLPGILAATRRFPVYRSRLSSSISAHLAIGTCFALADIAIRVVVNSWLPWSSSAASQPFPKRFESLFLSSFHSNLLVYWAIIGVTQGLTYYRKFEERELRASQLETRLAHAQLQVLKMQLQPHFLFNTLHAISALVHKDPDAADRTIALLSDLLRLTLETGGAQEVSLQQETDVLQRYIEIELTRFGDRLSVRLDITDDVRDACVPSFLLQPLVENAIRHGIARRSEGGHISITAARRGDDLQLLIEDNGVGFPGAGPREGVGLRNTRARLEQLYGSAAGLTLSGAHGGGALVGLRIPFKTVPSAVGEGDLP